MKRLVFPVLALVAMSVGASFAGCSCSGELGNVPAKQPEPPPPPPPPPAPPPAPIATPAPAPVKVVKGVSLDGNKVKIPGELEFDVDKATLKTTPQSTEILKTLADFMKQNPNVTKLRIEGHTDNSGSADHNKKLSEDRAAAVAKWLGDNGVEPGRVKPIGYGHTKAIAPNDTAEHKALNRRSEFHVEEVDGKPAPTDAPGATPAPAASVTPAPAASDKTASPPPKPGDPKAPVKAATPTKH